MNVFLLLLFWVLIVEVSGRDLHEGEGNAKVSGSESDLTNIS